MWCRVSPSFKVINAVDELIRARATEYPRTMPDLSGGGTLLAASDYAGSHRDYDVTGVIVTSRTAWDKFDVRRRQVRESYGLGSRRMSYKGLNDRLKRHALTPFLTAASAGEGVLCCFAINQAIPSFIDADGTAYVHDPVLAEWRHWKPAVFERMLRAVSFVALLLAGLAGNDQEAAWITDQDEIAANDAQMKAMARLFGNMVGRLSNGRISRVRVTTTAYDSGGRELEDLAAVPDLAAGAVADTLSSFQHDGPVSYDHTLWLSDRLPEKTHEIGRWLRLRDQPLRRQLFAIEKGARQADINVSPLTYF